MIPFIVPPAALCTFEQSVKCLLACAIPLEDLILISSSRSSWSHSTALHARLSRTHIRVCQSTATVSCLEHRRQQIYRKGFVLFLRGKTLAALDMVCYSCACAARLPAWTSMHAHQAALLGRYMPSYQTLVPPQLPAPFSQRQRASHSCH